MTRQMTRQMMRDGAVLALLVALGAGSRFLQDLFPFVPPNVHAVAAVSLFAGYYLRSRALAVLAPLLAMTLSDAAIGRHHPLVMATVYGSLSVPVVFRRFLRGEKSLARVGLCCLASSLLFFLTTNLAHWYAFSERTWAELGACYLAAVPFFRFEACGNLCYAAAVFGLYWAAAGAPELAARPAASEVV